MSTPHPPLAGDETTTLRGFLTHYRATVRRQAEGLTAEQLDRPLPPSTMTLGGMLKHLALVEDWWFSVVLHGNDEAEHWASVDWEADDDWDWHSAAQDTPEQLLALYDAAIEAADREIERALAGPDGLDLLAQRSRHGEHPSLRWIMVHMVEEYARHAGHGDLIRESIDGRTGL
jgi:uncharacterized damage-inducible protein DinB